VPLASTGNFSICRRKTDGQKIHSKSWNLRKPKRWQPWRKK